jgi:hypothetical protein
MRTVPTLRVVSKDRAPELPDLPDEVRLALSEAAAVARRAAGDERRDRFEGDARDDAGRDHLGVPVTSDAVDDQ